MALVRSIGKTLLLYFLLQCAAFCVFYRLRLFPPQYVLLFIAVQAVFHGGVFFFLTKNSALFYNTTSGEKEIKVNHANKITLLRITMLPLLVFLTFVYEKYSEKESPPERLLLTLAFALTFATDIIDGRISRVKKLETYIGKILDSASDYLLLGIIAGAFLHFHLIKTWLFLIIIARLFLNALVMSILFLVQKKLRPQTTILGKIAIAVIMVLLVLEAAKIQALAPWIETAETAAALLIVISMIDKILYLVKGICQSSPRRPTDELADQSKAVYRQTKQTN